MLEIDRVIVLNNEEVRIVFLNKYDIIVPFEYLALWEQGSITPYYNEDGEGFRPYHNEDGVFTGIEFN